MSVWVWLAVAGVGGLGALARFTVDATIVRRLGRGLPSATFTVNVTAAFLLGLITGLTLSSTASLIAGSATVGSYSTFSTWMFESERLFTGGRRWTALAYLLASVVLGVGTAALGRAVGLAL